MAPRKSARKTKAPKHHDEKVETNSPSFGKGSKETVATEPKKKRAKAKSKKAPSTQTTQPTTHEENVIVSPVAARGGFTYRSKFDSIVARSISNILTN